jgi:hypothetical protein
MFLLPYLLIYPYPFEDVPMLQLEGPVPGANCYSMKSCPFAMRLQNWLGFVKISMEQFWKFAVPKVFSSWKCQPSVLKGNQIFTLNKEEKCIDIW